MIQIDPAAMPHATRQASATATNFELGRSSASVSASDLSMVTEIKEGGAIKGPHLDDAEFLRRMMILSAGSELGRILFAGEQVDVKKYGGRRNALVKLVGSTSYKAVTIPNATWQQLAKLFDPVIANWAPDEEPAQCPWAEEVNALSKEFFEKDMAKLKLAPGRKTGAQNAIVNLPDASPLTICRAFILAHPDLNLAHWLEKFFAYDGGAYAELSMTRLRSMFWKFIERCRIPDKDGDMVPLKPRRALVTELIDAIPSCEIAGCGDVLVPIGDIPLWRCGATEPKPSEMATARNGALHLPSKKFFPNTPRLFLIGSKEYDYLENPGPMPTWEAFIQSILGHDPEAVALLREWMGYLLTGDIRMQKILCLIGPPRSGKSTLTKVMEWLVGEAAVGSPTMMSLSTQFGMSSMIGKRLGIIADARFNGLSNHGAIVERLLTVSGMDRQDVDRKGKDLESLRLAAKVVLVSNDLPKLDDASGALADRLLVIKMTKSFYDREDHDLADKIKAEMPAILGWCIQGWDSLYQRGRFAEPASGRDVRLQIKHLGAPVAMFVDTCCVRNSDDFTPSDLVYAAFRARQELGGVRNIITEVTFGRGMASLGIENEPRTVRLPGGLKGERKNCYIGVTLKQEHIPNFYPFSQYRDASAATEGKPTFRSLPFTAPTKTEPIVEPKPACDDDIDLDALAAGITGIN